MRMNQRKHQRYQNGSQDINQNSIGGQMGRISPQFTGDYCGCRGRGTNQTNHRSFHQNAGRKIREYHQQQSQDHKTDSLNQQQTQVPGTQLQIVQTDFTEREKQHQENQHRLYNVDGTGHKRFGRGKKRNTDIYKIQNDSHCHGDGQSPVLTKTQKIHF